MKKKVYRILLISILIAFVLLTRLLNSTPDIPIEELKIKYANDASRFIEIDGLMVHYRDEGRGMPIVLLHGTSASLHTWDEWAQELSKKYRVIRMDLPAFGLTGPNNTNDYSMEYYEVFLNTFLTKLAIDSLYLGGNSLGGQIAWYYTSYHPQQVKKLVLVDPAGFMSKNEIPFVFKLARVPVLNEVLKKITPRAFIQNNLEEVYYDPHKITVQVIDRYHDLVRRQGNRTAFIARSNAPIVDHTDRLKMITAPTLLIWGMEDQWIPIAQSADFQKALPKSKLITLKETGHIPMEERPYESLAPVLTFLKDSNFISQ